MDGEKFDSLTRALGAGRSRRGVLKGLGAAALGALGLSRLGEADAARSHCHKPNTRCGRADQCCHPGQTCRSGTCVSSCTPNCAGKCGGASDGCGGSCQACCAPGDCPGSDTECQSRTCTTGVCGMAYAPSGTPLAAQTAGDCQQTVCDGSGGTTSLADNADLPADDGNPCTDDLCVDGVPSHPATAAGSPCSQGGGTVCDGAGMCVSACVPNCSNANACEDDGCGGVCGSCSTIDCNTAFCDGGACSYSSNSDANGQPCNGATGTCDTLGNCIANRGGPGTCPADSDYCATGNVVSCNGSASCHCYGTSTGARFCGLGSNNGCADCNTDADCVSAGFGVGAACVDLGVNCSTCGSNTPTHVCMAACAA